MKQSDFKQVEQFALDLMAAAEADDVERFYLLYEQLEQLCNTTCQAKNAGHPVYWETLADFTEDNLRAIELYELAFKEAKRIQDNEYKASILFSQAGRLIEQGMESEAQQQLERAEKFASFTEDAELQQDIQQLRERLG